MLAYWGLFGSAFVRTKTASLRVTQQEETPISEEKTFTIHPSFLQTAIEVCQQRNGGRVSRSLRYYPILPSDSAVFELCSQGDLEGFKIALTRNEVPISAQSWDGWTLLHSACQSGNIELCSLLIHLGADPGHADIFGRKALDIFSNCADESSSCAETVIRLLITSQMDLTGNEVDECSTCYIGPPEGLECMISPDVYPEELDWRHLPLKPLLTAVQAFSLNAPEWTNLMRKIVRLSTDLHRVHEPQKRTSDLSPTERCPNLTLLDELFKCVYDPIEGAPIARAWLSILATEGHDVTRYLETEMNLHADHECIQPARWTNLDRKLFFCFAEPSVEWDWWINPEAPASLLCNEFRHMICRYETRRYWEWGWEHSWPFLIPEWSARCGRSSYRPDRNKKWQKMNELARSRAARRVEKKGIKSARVEGTYRPTRMPGA